MMKICLSFFLLLLTGCKFGTPEELNVKGKLLIVTSQVIVLEFEPYKSQPLCIPRSQYTDAENSIFVYDDKNQIIKEVVSDSREIYYVGGVDVADGLDVISDKKRKLFIDLSGFVLLSEQIGKVEFKLKYFNCSDFNMDRIPVKTLNLSIDGSNKTDFR